MNQHFAFFMSHYHCSYHCSAASCCEWVFLMLFGSRLFQGHQKLEPPFNQPVQKPCSTFYLFQWLQKEVETWKIVHRKSKWWEQHFIRPTLYFNIRYKSGAMVFVYFVKHPVFQNGRLAKCRSLLFALLPPLNANHAKKPRTKISDRQRHT